MHYWQSDIRGLDTTSLTSIKDCLVWSSLAYRVDEDSLYRVFASGLDLQLQNKFVEISPIYADNSRSRNHVASQ